MNRREFITLLGGAVTAWPMRARAQQLESMRRIGMLMSTAADDSEGQARVTAFLQRLQQRGWTVGRNVQIEYRWTAGDPERLRSYATELVALAPNVLVTGGASYVTALQQATRTVPIVFATATDPVGGGLVASLARPGGNITGFTTFEYGSSAKWLELLKQIVPRLMRVAVIRDPTLPTGTGQLGAIQSAAPSLGVELSPIDVRNLAELERAVTAFAQASNGGLIVQASPLATVNRDFIVTLAARHKLPAIYPERHFVAAGGLISYGPDYVNQYRQAAGYVDRILKGEKPSDLPVQAPTKYRTILNLKTAKALGLELPPTLIARADEVIE
jgi:putative tryptophan/tyrosine transport system substrate-binding protein